MQKDQSDSIPEQSFVKVMPTIISADIKVNQVTVEINSPAAAELPMKIEPTNEDEIVDIEGLDSEENVAAESNVPETAVEIKEVPPATATSPTEIGKSAAATKTESPESSNDDIDIEVQLRNITIKQNENKLSTSFPTQRSLWPFENHNTLHTYTPILNRGSLNFGEMLSNNLRRDRDAAHLRHSLSTSLSRNEKGATVVAVAANDTIAMLNDFMNNRSLWVSENTVLSKYFNVYPTQNVSSRIMPN